MAKLAPLPTMPASARKAKAPQKCACGCAELTRGGSFIPGHDSRMRGWAIRIIGGHDTTGITPGERAAAEAWIKAQRAKAPAQREATIQRAIERTDAAKATA